MCTYCVEVQLVAMCPQIHTTPRDTQTDQPVRSAYTYSVEELFYFTIVKSCDVFHKNPAGKGPVAQDFPIQVYLDFISPGPNNISWGS